MRLSPLHHLREFSKSSDCFPGLAAPPGGAAGLCDHFENRVTGALQRDLPAGVILRSLSDGPASAGDL